MSQQLPSKEQTLFRHLVQNYESKQYKKGLKGADQILKKHPTHGDTQAMKALILNTQGKSDEAFDLCKQALKNAMKSHVCWHVYGLLWRSVKNYEEAIKAYRFALKLDPESQQIQRDLALLQVQMRDYAGFAASRHQMLQARPQMRQNWTALAVAHHLGGDLDKAENILHRFEETLKTTPSKSDIEHAEAVLYKNTIIAEQGDYQRALEHLESIYRTALDRTAVMEYKAAYLLKLDKRAEAEKAYRALLDRNAEKREYYNGLEKSLGLERASSEDEEKLKEMYQYYADKNIRSDAARRIPLDFLTGDSFRKHADSYLRRAFTKGVPSTFANVKQLYSDSAKRDTIQQLVEEYVNEEPQANGGAEQNGSADGSHKTNTTSKKHSWPLSVNYFLAQHYNYHLSRDLAKAHTYSEKAIAINPSKTDYTYHMTRARILKHKGDVPGASKAMNEAREMDLKDRYINTKCAKYQLRNDENQAALDTMGLFTRKEAVGGPLGDLLDMQCVWFITEDGESYLRQGKYSLALKRFKALYDVFDVWQEDQFDFHTFSLRKGMIRAYIDMVRWEDKLREHPFFSRAALSAIKVYCLLHDRPEIAKGGANGAESAADKKKAAKKARKEADKAEAERKAAAAKKANPAPKDGEETARKEDPDPEGLELLKTEKPLEEAMKFLQPLLDLSPNDINAQIAGFEVYLRRKKYLPALRCLLAAHKLQPDHPKCHELGGRFKLALDTNNTLKSLPEPVQKVIQEHYLSKLSPKSLEECNEEYLTQHNSSVPHIQSVVYFRHILKPNDESTRTRAVKDLQTTLTAPHITIEEAQHGLQLLKDLGVSEAERKSYVDAALKKFPEATLFKA
ncbi:uncharacterized protein MYCFIDRAFT_55822 [Pseudocercospora fijiensis CIRAD86]|uniref:Uncharacterized protein n=1 Tax=Pseudocercospora fijiensis (strain CIRAD86) TaxID=383855 RepID=N1QBE1_PSEFD|nr:uncharacterized protein MYCFIDRAFT_55822 [Pseudocercospora fijiensis CIRAD86]EME89406.1 hypothetical protein MYCFIDRAFT_55822 [Pseudocercospora fijiensis CIRAD86]